MTAYIYSTLSQDVNYTFYRPKISSKDNINIVDRQILIKGSFGLNCLAGTEIITSKGTATKVSDEELELLLSNYSFTRHMELGFIKFDSKKYSVDKAIRDMNLKDRSRPLVPKDCEQTEEEKLSKIKTNAIIERTRVGGDDVYL